jgi:CubicO group peptidase (beta-lactamase class C family)
MKYLVLLTAVITFFSCQKGDGGAAVDPVPETMYFPSTTDNTWETRPVAGLGWNESAIQPLKDFLVQKNTKSFIILVNGRIVMEEYFNGHTKDSIWQWNSAGKTLVSAVTGIAQQNGILNINNAASQYLGTNWTSAPIAKENLISVKHLLSMTTGLNDSSNLVIKSNMSYMADAGTRWAYGNVFQKLMDVVENASGQSFDTYFNTQLKNKLGMNGYWNYGVLFKVYNSNTRSMARFGLMALNKGKWNGQQIINETFFNQATTTSQNINPSYGYLWWLNGKSNFMIPGSQIVFSGTLVPNAPADMYAAMGAEDQRIYVIPSKNMVVVRMGNVSDPGNPTFAVSGFDNDLWQKIKAVTN